MGLSKAAGNKKKTMQPQVSFSLQGVNYFSAFIKPKTVLVLFKVLPFILLYSLSTKLHWLCSCKYAAEQNSKGLLASLFRFQLIHFFNIINGYYKSLL